MSRELDSYNQRVIEAFRANGGVVEPASTSSCCITSARDQAANASPRSPTGVVQSTLAIFAPVFSGLQPPLPVPNWG